MYSHLFQWSAGSALHFNIRLMTCHCWPDFWVEEKILTPLLLSPNPFRLVRANTMIMRWWQMPRAITILLTPRHMQSLPFCLMKTERDVEYLTILSTYRHPTEIITIDFNKAVIEIYSIAFNTYTFFLQLVIIY